MISIKNISLMEYPVKVLAAVQHTKSIKHFIVSKPVNYNFTSGQSMEVSVETGNIKRPYAIICPEDSPNLEFMAKTLPASDRFSRKIGEVKAGDLISIGEPVGRIRYKGAGYFIAGGTGITPFISIFRQLQENDNLDGNYLIYSARNSADVIMERELHRMFGNNWAVNYTESNKRIDLQFMREKIKSTRKFFYLCGPELMMENVKNILLSLGVDENLLVLEACQDMEANAA